MNQEPASTSCLPATVSTRPPKAGPTVHGGYVLDRDRSPNAHQDKESDKQKLAWGWRLIGLGLTRHEAFIHVSATFWANHVPDEHGRIRLMLRASHLRPSFGQFVYWGRRLNGGAQRGSDVESTRLEPQAASDLSGAGG